MSDNTLQKRLEVAIWNFRGDMLSLISDSPKMSSDDVIKKSDTILHDLKIMLMRLLSEAYKQGLNETVDIDKIKKMLKEEIDKGGESTIIIAKK